MSLHNDLGQPIGQPIETPSASDGPLNAPMDGTYCRLEPLRADAHAASLFEAYAEAEDDGDWTYLPYGPFTVEADFREFVTSVQGRPDPMFFAIIDDRTGLPAGVASYLRVDNRNASIEVGHIHLSRRLQRTPAATEAMYLMMERAFRSGYRRYEWKCDDLNGPSRAAAKRLGFSYEGIFRQATHYKGRNRDTAWFAVIDSEWPARQAEFQRWLRSENFDAAGNQKSSLSHI